jgi:hypothetical protein
LVIIRIEISSPSGKGKELTTKPFLFQMIWNGFDAPLNFSRDLKVGPKAKQRKKKKVGARSLTHNTLRVGGHARVPRWD